MTTTRQAAVLVLADGSIFEGYAIGAIGESVGEIVFNTSMTGYQEVLTDPSYAQQIVTLTYPHVGNTGVNAEDNEAKSTWIKGLVIRDLPLQSSNWRQQQTLTEFLQQHHIVGIAGTDTRQLTRKLRDSGAQNACLMAGNVDIERALMLATSAQSLKGLDLAQVVTTAKAYGWSEPLWQLNIAQPLSSGGPAKKSLPAAPNFKVVVMDYGVKQNLLRYLVQLGCQLVVLPARSSLDQVLAEKPDGVFLSNGPGDPAPCDYAILLIEQLLERNMPILGICLGHQLLALACGARTEKMKFGHHGANHPVKNLMTGQVMITSQNHGFAVSDEQLPSTLQVTHRSLFDQSIQGIRHISKPAYAFQGHPEASPGPHDAEHLFVDFIAAMKAGSLNNRH
jgi:carbamoyl-phosphate synthase small subunit